MHRCMFLALLSLWASVAWAQTPPHQPRPGANLLTNFTLSGTANWSLTSGAVYDAAQSRSADGSGAVRTPVNGRIDSTPLIPVTPGNAYTFAAYMRTDAFPPANYDLAVTLYNSSGTYIGFVESGPAANSTTGVWEEVLMSFTPQPGTAFITVVVVRLDFTQPNTTSNLWVDELYFGLGSGFGSPPAARTPFVGTNMQVDELGNVSVKKAGVWTPFFPLCIYSDGRRPNYLQFYSNQGFNCDGWGAYDSNILVTGKNAVSAFNPDGMYQASQIAQYMNTGGWGYDAGGVNLTNLITALKASPAADHLLWWYWDNENVWNLWGEQMNMVDVLKAQDRTAGIRNNPLFILQGSYNVTRSYRRLGGLHASEMAGTYADATASGGSGHAGGFDIVMNLQNQTIPATLVNANIVSSSQPVGTLRGYIYKFLPRGLRAFTMWRDCYPNDCDGNANPVETAGWWPDVPYLRTELDALLPLIRMPHWTSWTVSHNGGNSVSVGTRDYLGQGYLMVLNESAAPKTITFTLSGLPYTATTVLNYFTNATVTSVSGNTFTVTLPALGLNSGSAVYKLAGVAGPPDILTGLIAHWRFSDGAPTATDSSGNGHTGTFVAGATYGAGPPGFGTALALNGTNQYVTVADTALLDVTSAYTIAAWLFPTATTGARVVLVKDYVYYLYNNLDYCGGPLGGHARTDLCYPTLTPANTWTHLALTFVGSTLTLYKNGTAVATQGTTGVAATSSNALTIGASQFGEYFPGRLDDVRLYSRALSAADITALQTATGIETAQAPRRQRFVQ